MALSNPLAGPPEQDYIILGQHKSPGRATIRGASSPRKWEQRAGYGMSGATCVFIGIPLPEFEIEILLSQPAHWIDWEVFAKLYLGTEPGPPSLGPFLPIIRPKAVGIQHPLLTKPPLDIKEVVFTDISQWDAVGDGSWKCVLKCMQFKPPKPMLGKPDMAIPAGSKPVPSAQDAVDAELAAKRAEFNRLAAGGR